MDRENKQQYDVEQSQEVDSDSASHHTTANGVKEIEAVTQVWTKSGLYTFWAAAIFLGIAMAFEFATLTTFTNYAVSEFGQYSLISTLQAVQGVLNVVLKPPLAKLIDAVGRLEAFIISCVSFTVGLILLAASPNMGAYFAGQVFHTIGNIGLSFLTYVYAIDTADLRHRALMTVITSWSWTYMSFVAARVTTEFLEHSSWRWGVGMWAIVIPVACIPLAIVLFLNRQKARKAGLAKQKKDYKLLFKQLDVIGSVMLAVGLTLVFLAIPLASSDAEAWRSPKILCMIIIGGISLIAFIVYEWKDFPEYPVMNKRLMQNSEIIKCFFFYMCFYLGYYIYGPYFFGWLRVVFDLSNTAAANVTAAGDSTRFITSIIVAILVKYTRRLSWAIVLGGAITLLGTGLVFAWRKPDTSLAKLIVAQCIQSLGSGMMGTPNQVMVQCFCSHEDVTQTVALYLSFLSLGQVIGDAVSGSLYRHHYVAYLRQNFPDASETWIHAIINDFNLALEIPYGSETRMKIVDAYNSTMRILLIPPFFFYAAMFIIGLSYPNVKLDRLNDGLKGLIFGSAKPLSDENETAIELARAREAHWGMQIYRWIQKKCGTYVEPTPVAHVHSTTQSDTENEKRQTPESPAT